jgi:hypothetical protein
MRSSCVGLDKGHVEKGSKRQKRNERSLNGSSVTDEMLDRDWREDFRRRVQPGLPGVDKESLFESERRNKKRNARGCV